MAINLDNRARRVLMAIIEDYIQMGDPVGSRTISKKRGIDVSPATIRNIMSDLEDVGLLVQPHTSAGRIPTENAFRFYVDHLVQVRDAIKDPQNFEANINPAGMEIKDIVREVSRILSKISHCTSLVRSPRFAETVFKYINFVKLSENRILAILVSRSGMVHNKLIIGDEELNTDKLNWMSNYLNDLLSNLTLMEVRRKIIKEMEDERTRYNELLFKALSMSRALIEDEVEEDLIIGGSSYILDYPEFTDVEKMKKIFQAFENKGLLLKLLDKVSRAEGIKVFIGSESNIQDMIDCTLIASPYKREGRIVGSVGVIGPTRMDYARVIPVVDFTAQLIGSILDEM
ncbi:MAG: heat-inducible transcription repressor HrcA [Deltaproteobacteria bacterium]|nr:heat-inducible transcription repressor HrcA [Candidatus Zymogenaceae bacterium]